MVLETQKQLVALEKESVRRLNLEGQAWRTDGLGAGVLWC